MPETNDDHHGDVPLNERLLDVFVFVPAGIAVSVVEELPKLAARGRERLGIRVSSARAMGEFAVRAGRREFHRRSKGLVHRAGPVPGGSVPSEAGAGTGDRGGSGAPASGAGTRRPEPARPVDPATPSRPSPGSGHVPSVSALSIPGFDALSASQVVQRLDGLNRSELVSVRTYESSTRGRRTILSRVDQLLDERS
ncbi:MAG TPA: hypothetical protein VMV06_10380 [Acidimicrobiales bacterium]|nr:hypothetical protein [Acidimicrobiales bacterium]HUZ09303.1 hypothetical protein [Acidimicrobiales bacterium]